MLYHLFNYKDLWSPLNIFQYITFRTGGAFLTSLFLVLILGNFFIQLIKRWEITQHIREYGPQTHLEKSGTPTMGGLLILFALLGSTILWARLDNRFIQIILFSAVVLGGLGFWDDYRKLILKHPAKGLSQGTKLTFQLMWALVVVGYLFINPPNTQYSTLLQVPYLKNVFMNLGSLIILLGLVALVGSSNAVNLTDGLDGLVCGILVICAITFGLLAYLAGHATLSTYLRLIPVSGAGELSIYLGALAGACLGFLWFNSYPAAIFMGDTGSLFLGGTIGVVALAIKQEIILIVVGGIFVAEALSVLLQIGSVRLTGKRIFLMAPLHHHFEMKGWPETKVTMRFWIVAVVLALLALTSLKLR